MHGYEIRATKATESKRAAYYDRRAKTNTYIATRHRSATPPTIETGDNTDDDETTTLW